MDWHAWLSGARLEPAMVYEYALVFARNELEADDVAFLDHEILHSMGISVAKHRLEILKLTWRDRGLGRGRGRSSHSPPALSRLLDRVARYVRSLVRREESTALVLVPCQQQPDDLAGGSKRRGKKALRRAKSEPKGSTPRATIGGRGAAAVHAMRDVENGAGAGDDVDGMVRWDRLFQDLKPN
ncbi:uncharacterized protein LOC133923680 [Phragmites australis]|uniref:uncharacterized protein LOC133923680 n=1 Tax=Phragmites australis TaxID=29695 RepID=UPI002D78DC6B|nr:uncharacterized protein LOC133923680 [Phragmites australis]